MKKKTSDWAAYLFVSIIVIVNVYYTYLCASLGNFLNAGGYLVLAIYLLFLVYGSRKIHKEIKIIEDKISSAKNNQDVLENRINQKQVTIGKLEKDIRIKNISLHDLVIEKNCDDKLLQEQKELSEKYFKENAELNRKIKQKVLTHGEDLKEAARISEEALKEIARLGEEALIESQRECEKDLIQAYKNEVESLKEAFKLNEQTEKDLEIAMGQIKDWEQTSFDQDNRIDDLHEKIEQLKKEKDKITKISKARESEIRRLMKKTDQSSDEVLKKEICNLSMDLSTTKEEREFFKECYESLKNSNKDKYKWFKDKTDILTKEVQEKNGEINTLNKKIDNISRAKKKFPTSLKKDLRMMPCPKCKHTFDPMKKFDSHKYGFVCSKCDDKAKKEEKKG
ncbi:unnamed protein product [marine sediment metagenome]|uniref:Uncharacterized protein n=1 Tax=marine sediment metagenome TaxID=412755 RepID=X0T6I5_9ZZZZ